MKYPQLRFHLFSLDFIAFVFTLFFSPLFTIDNPLSRLKNCEKQRIEFKLLPRAITIRVAVKSYQKESSASNCKRMNCHPQKFFKPKNCFIHSITEIYASLSNFQQIFKTEKHLTLFESSFVKIKILHRFENTDRVSYVYLEQYMNKLKIYKRNMCMYSEAIGIKFIFKV